jgi:lysophospholipase L1-like esterase
MIASATRRVILFYRRLQRWTAALLANVTSLVRLRLTMGDARGADADPRSLPVLCFGDSITEGYYNVWAHPEFAPQRVEGRDSVQHEVSNVRFRPYAVQLGALLASDAGDAADGYKAALRYARARAYSGWTAVELLPELHRSLREGPWRCAVILAGCNDILMENPAAEVARVLSSLEQMYSACERAGVRVLALTPLDCDTEQHSCVPPQERDARRAALAAVADGVRASCKRHGRACVDTRAWMPLCAEHFDDSTHPSPAGYDRLATAIHAAIRGRGW